MSNHKLLQFLFDGQSEDVANDVNQMLQTHAHEILPKKGNDPHQQLQFIAVSSQREALRIVRANSLHVMLLETGENNGDRKKFAAMVRKLQPLARLIEVGKELTPSPQLFDGFLKLPIDAKQAVELFQRSLRPTTSHLIQFGAFVLDTVNDCLIHPKGERALRPMETKLLVYLLEKRNQIVTRSEIMREVWRTEYMGDTRTLDVHIRHIRQQLEENPSVPQYLITERGLGYILKV